MPRKLVAAFLIAAVVLAGSAALLAFGPPEVQFWRCQDRVERPSPRAAVDAYYEHCRSHGVIRTDGLDQRRAGWYSVRSYGMSGRPGVSFVFIGRRSPHSGWTVIEETSGP